jgi:hypothetical protein
MNEEAFQELLGAYQDEGVGEFGGSRRPGKWAAAVAGQGYDGPLAPVREPMTRAKLHDFCCTEPSISERVLAICAWGGMRVYRGRELFRAKEKWEEAISLVVEARPTRGEAYQRFSELRQGGCLPGMGPAYFTKLMYFLGADQRGYIMDQWTARSVNLLFSDPLIALHQGAFVADTNDALLYETFCGRVEEIAGELSHATGKPITPDEAEMAMFSKGGRKAGRWRRYVKLHG